MTLKKSNDEVNKCLENEAINAMEARRITAILKNQIRWVECGSIFQICKTGQLEPELYDRMQGDWIYDLVSNERGVCKVTGSVAYQVNWSIAYLLTGNSVYHSWHQYLCMTSRLLNYLKMKIITTILNL